jgi:hypothetical protein
VHDGSGTDALDGRRHGGAIGDVEIAVGGDDVVALGGEQGNEVSTHETSRTGDEYAHGEQAARPRGRVL